MLVKIFLINTLKLVRDEKDPTQYLKIQGICLFNKGKNIRYRLEKKYILQVKNNLFFVILCLSQSKRRYIVHTVDPIFRNNRLYQKLSANIIQLIVIQDKLINITIKTDSKSRFKGT